ncbi:RidA family protein [Candidatus Sumerlaeota bacterium]|nr:RidA family protein [Candidatus Sumerlaeota bacterium]HNM46299.1 Rid family hydrolase [Candidatus Sumerlaeota bacterium]
MAERVSIFVEGAPSAFGHFSQVIKHGNSVHISGQLPVDPKTNRLVSMEIGPQAKAVFENLSKIMQACAGQMSNILLTRIYLTDLRDHSAVDVITREVFFFTPPARTVVMVAGLPFGAKIMVEAVAELNPIEMAPKRVF